MSFTGFDRTFFRFLKALKAHNTREWFAAHKAQYQEDVEGPALAFITEFAPRLKAISPRFMADPRRAGGSLFRIYRDTRFSHDKTPYKTHVGIRFQHDAGKLGSAPAFYLHVAPGECFGGGGCYHTDPVSLRRIRMRIAEAPGDWKAVLAAGLEIQGDSLQRVPAGFPADHRFAADLKRKDHFVMTSFKMGDVASAAFVDQYAATCEQAAPLMRFLTKALGQAW